jgi:hypothetical protein
MGQSTLEQGSKEIPLSNSHLSKHFKDRTSGTYSSKKEIYSSKKKEKKKKPCPFVQRQERWNVKHLYNVGNNSGS